MKNNVEKIAKGIMTLFFSAKGEKIISKRNILAIILASIVNAVAYYGFEAIIMKSLIAPLASVPYNLLQGVAGGVVFIILGIIIDKNKGLSRIIRGKK